MTKIEIFHKWNGSFRPNLGDRDGGSFIVVLAGDTVHRMTIVRTLLGTDSARTILVGGWTVVIGPMVATAAGTNSGIIHGFNSFLGTKFLEKCRAR